ncbi:EAL domain-containing protein [Hippea jasoniae]|uniref:EAL domain-containing protein n=1 Tax=Hippea jasoniae TaxID=944479 RepID=UPI000689603A|nr:EAL domain-containing protein [Hippea jasoniae]
MKFDKELFLKIRETAINEQIKVLYVEDKEDVLLSTKELLSNFFEHLDTATDGFEGLEKFKQNPYDIIITDINLPKMDGLEMAKKIKEIDKKIPIIVITAFTKMEYLLESIKIGVYGYILKPIDMDQLLETLNRVVEKVYLRKERDRAVALLEQYKKIIDEGFTVTKTDPTGVITYANDKFCKISGYSREELIGKPHNIVRHPDMPKKAFKDLWNTIKAGKIWRGVVKNKTKDGKSFYVKATVAPIFDENGKIKEYIAVRENITDIVNPRKLIQDKIIEFSNPLLVLGAIEDFDDLENLYGESIIEELQEVFVKKAKSLFPPQCQMNLSFNMGDGRFAFIKDQTEKKEINEILYALKQFQENIRNTKFSVGEYEFELETVLSLATQKDHMFKNAELGLKKALKEKLDIVKGDGLYQTAIENAKKNIATLKMIKDAIKNDRIVSYFQPIYNNKTDIIEKYESLVRLIDKDGKVLSPFFFLNVAKIGKYYKQITRIVIKNAIETLKIMPNKEISINLSAVDIEDESIRNEIFAILENNPDISKKLVVELLEDEGINQLNVVKNFIKKLKGFGVKIAIDDFGSGYSNFSRLIEYEPDYIKIDASLIKDITTNKNNLHIVEAIRDFAKKQGYKTVAEYVSNEEIFRIVKELGIDYSQGYYISEPLPEPI